MIRKNSKNTEKEGREFILPGSTPGGGVKLFQIIIIDIYSEELSLVSFLIIIEDI